MTRRRLMLGILAIMSVVAVAVLGGVHLAFAVEARSQTLPPGTARTTSRQPDGQPLAVYRQPGPPDAVTVILVHGTPGRATNFDAQFAAGIPGASLIAYDRPGFAHSPGGDAAARLDYQTDTLLKLIGETASPVVLVGHSYGGAVVLNAALRAPATLLGVVLVAGSVTPEMEKLWLVQRPANWPPFAWLLPSPLRACNREIIRLEPELVAMNARFDRLQVPILALQGTDDSLVPVGNIPLLEQKLAAAGKAHLLQARVFSGWNHFMLWRQAPAINREIETFLRETRPQP